MTNIKEGMAQAVMEAFYKDWTDEPHLDDYLIDMVPGYCEEGCEIDKRHLSCYTT